LIFVYRLKLKINVIGQGQGRLKASSIDWRP